MKLYEISAGFGLLNAALEENGGELTDEMAEGLEKLELLKEEKLQGCCIIHKNFIAEANAIAEEIKRLESKKKACENAANNMKNYIARNIEEGETWSNGIHGVGWRKSTAVEITGEVPEQYVQMVPKILKAEIKTDLKAGADLTFAELITRQNLQIL